MLKHGMMLQTLCAAPPDIVGLLQQDSLAYCQKPPAHCPQIYIIYYVLCTLLLQLHYCTLCCRCCCCCSLLVSFWLWRIQLYEVINTQNSQCSLSGKLQGQQRQARHWSTTDGSLGVAAICNSCITITRPLPEVGNIRSRMCRCSCPKSYNARMLHNTPQPAPPPP